MLLYLPSQYRSASPKLLYTNIPIADYITMVDLFSRSEGLKFYRRFVDDIFFIWSGNLLELDMHCLENRLLMLATISIHFPIMWK